MSEKFPKFDPYHELNPYLSRQPSIHEQEEIIEKERKISEKIMKEKQKKLENLVVGIHDKIGKQWLIINSFLFENRVAFDSECPELFKKLLELWDQLKELNTTFTLKNYTYYYDSSSEYMFYNGSFNKDYITQLLLIFHEIEMELKSTLNISTFTGLRNITQDLLNLRSEILLAQDYYNEITK